MKFDIKHDIKGRMCIHVKQQRMSYREADILQYYLEEQPFVLKVKVRERTRDVVIYYEENRETLIAVLKSFTYKKAEVPELVLENCNRELSAKYWEKLVTKI